MNSDDKKQLFDRLHKNIMDRAVEWATAKNCQDFHQGMLAGAIQSWLAVALLYSLEGYSEIYHDYRALWIPRR